MSRSLASELLRSLKFLQAGGSCKYTTVSDGGNRHALLTSLNGKKILLAEAVIETLLTRELVTSDNQFLLLSELGRKRLRRALGQSADDKEGFAAQHRTIEQRNIRVDGAVRSVSVNIDESPLSRLRSRKDGTGRAWVGDAAFEAGERLRRDFTIGGLMQKVTASWDAAIGGAGTKAGASSKADLADISIDARRRFGDALDTLGPDLAGVLMDFCCFLKGLECIERERRWPPRSAKLMLRTGLEMLARHYGLETATISHEGKRR